jgi:hypothetical protein
MKINETPQPALLRITAVALLVAALISALTMFVLYYLRVSITTTTTLFLNGNIDTVSIVDAGIRGALTFIILTAAIFGIPALWRIHSHPRILRTLAIIGSQTPALTAGILIFPLTIAIIATGITSAWGAIWWVVWSTRWKGSGVAPSLLTGVLKPRIHPGQIWFAYIQGHHEGKVRPVIIMNTASTNSWEVLYFTSQEPKKHLEGKYVAAPAGSLRGLPSQNFLEIKDNRILKNSKFRKYVGLSPRWLYDAAATHSGITPAPDALVIEEMYAGEHMGPFERAIFEAIFTNNKNNRQPENTLFRESVQKFLSLTLIDRIKRKTTK